MVYSRRGTLKSFGEQVRKVRLEKELSYRQLATIVSEGGITSTTGAMLNVIEKGVKVCSYRLCIAISRALGLDPDLSLRTLFLERTKRCRDREKLLLEIELSDPELRKLFDFDRVVKS